MNVTTLGEVRFPSPILQVVDEHVRVPLHLFKADTAPGAKELGFELAGPRAKLFFDPMQTRAAIVTCGGLCPGLNNVIRSVFMELHHIYGVKEVIGFRDGYRGLDPATAQEPIVLTPGFVEDIHKEGGTVLNTSRGPVNAKVAVDNLIMRGVNILFTVGGDGSQRGGRELFLEAQRRGHALAVVGIPKTIDNDVPYVSRTFGYLTAVEEAVKVITCAHMEAHSVHNGISIVKLMGRNAGFIAASATVASQDVNFCLVPEQPFQMEGENGFLAALKRRVLGRAHAVVVVAEGAGQDLVGSSAQRDASGNLKLKDIGLFLKEQITDYLKAEQVPATIRYIDPSYIIRSVPADAEDAILCDFFARHAVHAAMAGRTGVVIGLLHDQFIHVPIELLSGQRKQLDLNGLVWRSVLSTTGQPSRFG